MNEVVIRILDSTNNVLGDLDLENFNDFPLVITKGIVNLDNLKSRTGTYTKTFKAPNTKNNSNLLSNVDNINSRKDYRDALGRKPCIIMVNGNEVEKISFLTKNKETITWKPKKEITEWRKGLEILSIGKAAFEDLPERLFDMNQVINEKGFVKVKADYMIWNKETDGSIQTFRFLRGNNSFDEWVIIPEKVVEEEKVET